jgi:hypothetical protein
MRMGEDDRFDPARLDRKWRPILKTKRHVSLKQAAIDKNTMVVVFDGEF